MINLDNILANCQNGDRKAQKELYDYYGPMLLAICRRYVKEQDDAEDVFIQAFYKIFSNISRFKSEGSFEGWMKRIMINESLMFLRQRKNFHLTLDHTNIKQADPYSVVDAMSYEELLSLLNELPDGYRTVFNLYVIEGYKHREIAEELNISINTSKSQLIQAKKKMQELIKKKHKLNVDRHGR